MHRTFIIRCQSILLYSTVMSWLWRSISHFFFLTDFFISFSEMCRVPCFICANEFVMSSTCLLICSLHKQKRGQRKSSGYVKCMWLLRLVILPRHWTRNRNTIQKSKKTDDKTQGYIFLFKNNKLILSIRIFRALDLIWKFRNTFYYPIYISWRHYVVAAIKIFKINSGFQ